MNRIKAIDFVRGLAMVIMALDHVRDLIHVDSLSQSPIDMNTTTPILFFTRWITHLCAPTFVFLAGTSAYISFRQQGNIAASRKLLITRGLWLILLEFTVINFAIFGDVNFHAPAFLVIAAIGFGFIILGVLLKVPAKILGIAGLAIIFLHNLLPLIPFSEGSTLKTILSPLFGPTAFPITKEITFIMGYPPIPWLGVMLAGFGAGQLFSQPQPARDGMFLKIGFSALAIFLVLRFINVYGDPVIWSTQKSSVFSFLSFMNVTKYGPSLLFCLVTLGIMFLLLASYDHLSKRLTNFFIVYGKVPLFYFIVHFYLIHFILIVVLKLQGIEWSQFEVATGTFGRPRNISTGLNLALIYLVWIGVVLIMYKPCEWFGRYKKEHKYWWLKYL